MQRIGFSGAQLQQEVTDAYLAKQLRDYVAPFESLPLSVICQHLNVSVSKLHNLFGMLTHGMGSPGRIDAVANWYHSTESHAVCNAPDVKFESLIQSLEEVRFLLVMLVRHASSFHRDL